jgi:hypothetical protein
LIVFLAHALRCIFEDMVMLEVHYPHKTLIFFTKSLERSEGDTLSCMNGQGSLGTTGAINCLKN